MNATTHIRLNGTAIAITAVDTDSLRKVLAQSRTMSRASMLTQNIEREIVARDIATQNAR